MKRSTIHTLTQTHLSQRANRNGCLFFPFCSYLALPGTGISHPGGFRRQLACHLPSILRVPSSAAFQSVASYYGREEDDGARDIHPACLCWERLGSTATRILAHPAPLSKTVLRHQRTRFIPWRQQHKIFAISRTKVQYPWSPGDGLT